MVNQEGDVSFDLRTARALVDEVAEQTEDVVQLQRLADQEERFWEGVQASWKVAREVGALEADLNRAVQLAMGVSTTQPDARLDDGTSPATVIAAAHYQRGLIQFRLRRWQEALQNFEESYEVADTQEALLNIALCKGLQQRRIRNPVAMYLSSIWWLMKCMILWWMFWNWKRWAREFVGIFVSGRYSRDDILAAFRRVIDADPNSDLAVEAGKWIARLTRP